MRENLRWLGHILRMKGDRFPKIVLFGQLPRAKRKAGRPRLVWEGDVKKDLRGWNSLGGCKEGGFE